MFLFSDVPFYLLLLKLFQLLNMMGSPILTAFNVQTLRTNIIKTMNLYHIYCKIGLFCHQHIIFIAIKCNIIVLPSRHCLGASLIGMISEWKILIPITKIFYLSQPPSLSPEFVPSFQLFNVYFPLTLQ